MTAHPHPSPSHPSYSEWKADAVKLAEALRGKFDVEAALPKWEKDIRKETGKWDNLLAG
jgi:hypothetical protein